MDTYEQAGSTRIRGEPIRASLGGLRRRLAVVALASGAGVLAAMWAETPGHAYTRNNPRWEAPGHDNPKQFNKPYKPLRQPPGSLPPRPRHGGGEAALNSPALAELAGIVTLGIGAQWLAALMSVPTAFPLAILGFMAGPITGLLDPDVLLGPLLLPLVSLSLAVIIFLEMLNARRFFLEDRRAIRLASVSILICGVAAALAAHVFLDFSGPLAVLLGLILAMSGPVAAERIAADLTGSVLVLVVFEALLAGGRGQLGTPAALLLRPWLAVSLLAGVLGGVAVSALLKGEWAARALRPSLSLALVIAVFAVADVCQAGAGFLAIIVMGAVVCGQESVPVEAVARLHGRLYDVLSALVLTVLFARASLGDLIRVGAAGAVLVGVVVAIAFPLAVALSTRRRGFGWRERMSLWAAGPRGLLPAGLSAVCAARVTGLGAEQTAQVVPLTLLVIACTATAGACVAALVARWEPNAAKPCAGPSVRRLKWWAAFKAPAGGRG